MAEQVHNIIKDYLAQRPDAEDLGRRAACAIVAESASSVERLIACARAGISAG
jgi:hypothetical protein